MAQRDLNAEFSYWVFQILKIIELCSRVHPSLVSNNSMISKVDNELNTIIVDDEVADKIMIVGKGAGQKPTAASVIADILNIHDENKKFFVTSNKKVIIKFKGY